MAFGAKNECPSLGGGEAVPRSVQFSFWRVSPVAWCQPSARWPLVASRRLVLPCPEGILQALAFSDLRVTFAQKRRSAVVTKRSSLIQGGFMRGHAVH